MSLIDRTFKTLKREERKALIGYVTAGFPTKASLRILVPLLEKSGVDLLELGIPFSDPIADGPTIQHSSHIALKNGTTLKWVLESVRQLRQDGVKLPLILMSYCNPLHAMGIDAFFHKAKACGVDGLIIPDMIPEEAGAYAASAKAHGIDLIYLVAPTTPKLRIRTIAKKTQGFLYAVSLTGVTGVRKAVPADVKRFLCLVKSSCSKPIAVGFGLTTSKQVQSISRFADGVIVGSELIRRIEKSKKTSFKNAANYIKSLRHALDTTPHPQVKMKKELSHAS